MSDRVIQLLANGVMAGSVLALPAIGLTLVFAVLRFTNFALAAHLAVGAYAGYWVNSSLGASVWLAVPVGFATAGLVGVVTQQLVLGPFARTGVLVAAIASIALNVVLENVLRFAFGNDLRSFDTPLRRDLDFGPFLVAPQQIENLAVSLVAMLALFLFFRWTRTGKAMRAAADDPVLADIKGIDPVRMAAVATMLGMGLAGVGGVLIGADTMVDPTMGFRVILSVFGAAVLGGLGNVPGALVGALAIGIAEELSLLILSPTYKGAVGFAAILLMLSLRPSGLFGARAGA